ncbi:transglutaminase-like domain-containing protein [Algoriphagus winogradskyi]|jgi:regulator of sirC expression with transglutaminase-like and TPR domain|uniref:Regulator of sirC expression, contains transglutaminase-like and TPR domains n=1 Tax=Algoriphagus winogradskyi TaxID=237017 RepID=A0ABY1PI03_9BACT|nr:transglutaminase-like domain-containing protein [Algoriphagus winogradskyi]SMP34077.1 Regulator of sirC expression, contains transglutaminase-like and TPR domains [Algoriphagus winogradskyi]
MSDLTPGELNALVSLLDDSDREVRMHVRDRIISLGNDIIPFLEKKWENSFNPDIQKEIEELVHDLQFSLLKERLKDWRDTDDRDLLTGLWIINTYQYPDLEYARLNAEMHQIYFEVWTAFKNDLSPYEQVRAINNVLFNTLRFSANTKNFHSPANSMLSSVLDSKRGNPLTLCSIYLLVAKKLGLPIYGVNLPNLFVLTYKSADVTFYINAFNKGLIFSRKDIFNYLEQLKIEPKEDYFEPCAHLQIMLRMFRNLENSFEKLGEADKVQEIKELIALLNDQ